MLLNIKVTAEHIKNGHTCKSRICPVALALMEVIDNLRYYVEVWARKIYIYPREGNYPKETITSPERVIIFVARYDAGLEDAKPFEFEIEIPEQYLILK